MGTMYEMTTLELNCTFTGSMYSYGGAGANFLPSVTLPPDGHQTLETGSWEGCGNTWGISTTVIDTLSASMSQSIEMGTWQSATQPDHSWGVLALPTESINRSVSISDTSPSVNQSIGPGDWNPFPIPPSSVGPALPPRDLTRYRKAYSSQRLQPNRIRLVRS